MTGALRRLTNVWFLYGVAMSFNVVAAVINLQFEHASWAWLNVAFLVALTAYRFYHAGQRNMIDTLAPDNKVEVMGDVAYVTPKKGEPYMIRIPEELLEDEDFTQIMGYIDSHLKE